MIVKRCRLVRGAYAAAGSVVGAMGGALRRGQFWVIASQISVALVTAWMAWETRQVAEQTRKSVALVGVQLREDKPLLKGEVMPDFGNLCRTQVILRNMGRREARGVKWRLYANLLDTTRRSPERRELTNGAIPELRAFIDPQDAIIVGGFDLGGLKDLRLTHRLYSLEFLADHMSEPLMMTDASLPLSSLDALCRN